MAPLPLSLINQHDHCSLHSFNHNVLLSQQSGHEETWELDKQTPEGSQLVFIRDTISSSSMAPLPLSLVTQPGMTIAASTPKIFNHNVVLSEQSAHEETWEQTPEGSQLVDSEAWRFGVETNTVRSWTFVPPECVDYVKTYMLGSGTGSGSQYLRDSHMVANESIAYANSLKLSGDGKDVWIFDVDDTLISSLPYFAAHHYGGEGIDDDVFINWAALAENPLLPASHRLYSHLLELGFKIFLITGRYSYERNATEKNLVRVGYHSWEALFLREPEDYEKSAVVYKSEKRLKIEEDGFRIRGNSSDQWSDLTGYSVGERTFKLPNLMYWVG